MKNEVILIKTDGEWEGLFVNGKLANEGHHLGDGYGTKKYLTYVCKKYGVTLEEIKDGQATDDYIEKLNDLGSFDMDLSDVEYIVDDDEYPGD